MKAPFRTLLCPTDLSAVGDGAVGLAYALAADGGTVHLLHVCEPAFVVSPLDATPILATPSTPEGLEALEKKVDAHLEGLVPKGGGPRGVRTERHVVHEADAATVIEREAKRLRADAIVLGTHGRSGLSRALLGSVAGAVLRSAKRPVILAHDVPSKS